MQQQYQQLFQSLSDKEAPPQLCRSVLLHIRAVRLRAMRIKFALSSLLGLASGAALFPLASSVVTEISRSGFVDYASLALSDGGAVVAYWQEFSITLIESLPLLGLTMILLALFTLLQSFRLAVKNSDAVFIHSYS